MKATLPAALLTAFLAAALPAPAQDAPAPEAEALPDADVALAETVASEDADLDAAVEAVSDEVAAEVADADEVESAPAEDPATEEAPAPEDTPASAGEALPPTTGPDAVVSMAFEQTPLEDVVAAFRTLTGANIVNAWTNHYTQLVSVRLDNVPWRQGLTSILYPYDLQIREEPRGSQIYIIAPPTHAAPPRFTETFQLEHLEANDVAKLFASILGQGSFVHAEPASNVVIIKATDEQIAECRAVLEKIDKAAPQVYIEARFVRLSAGASKKLGLKWDSLENFGVSLSRLGGGFSFTDGKLATYGVESSARIATSGSGYSLTDTDGTKNKIVTRTTEETAQTGLYRHTAAASVSDTTVSTTLEDSTLANLTGDDLGYRRTAGFGGQLSVSDFGLVMSAFESLDGAQVFSNPKIIVRNGKTAVVDMTTKYPNIKIDFQQSTESGQRDSISSQLAVIPGKSSPWVGEAFFSYGITLEVTPTISPDGLITVEIIPTISELAGTKTVYVTSDSSIGNDYPVISLRKLDTKFTMEDGKTAVIGGLTETAEKTVDSGIPLLRHIPWIGPRLFGWKSREKSQDEILVFVTVRVAEPATDAADGLPKNAVLGRLLMDGGIKEPGDRESYEMWDLDAKPAGYIVR